MYALLDTPAGTMTPTQAAYAAGKARKLVSAGSAR